MMLPRRFYLRYVTVTAPMPLLFFAACWWAARVVLSTTGSWRRRAGGTSDLFPFYHTEQNILGRGNTHPSKFSSACAGRRHGRLGPRFSQRRKARAPPLRTHPLIRGRFTVSGV